MDYNDAETLYRLKAERTFEIAKIYLKRKKIINLYGDHFEIIEKNLDRKGWFQSSNEILVALELLRNGIKARHQVKYGKWKADFVIPDIKVVLEVDGLFHRGDRLEKDRLKDAAIVAHLGPEWEVIRISDILLKKKLTNLIPAIKTVLESRTSVRGRYEQKLPEWYSSKQI